MENFFNPQGNSLENSLHQRQQREIEQPIICETCGSNWFTEAIFNQYSSLAYGSGTGGDIRIINQTPQTLRICVCGRPYSPNLTGVRGRVASAELGTFQKSLEAAKGFLDKIAVAVKNPVITMTQIAKSFAGVEELTTVKTEVNELTRSYQNLESRTDIIQAAVTAKAATAVPAASEEKPSLLTTGNDTPAATITNAEAEPAGRGGRRKANNG